MAELVACWVRFYTRDLPTPIAQRRVDEIDADPHDHIAHERADGLRDRRITRDIASRMVRGLAADVAWRGRQAKVAAHLSTRRRRWRRQASLSIRCSRRARRGVDLVAAGGGDADHRRGGLESRGLRSRGRPPDGLGVALELAVKKAGNLAIAIGIAAVGVAAAIFGKADDAPGLVLLGILLIASASALGVRRARAQHSR
jgi:hypothetical protein